ncbi:apba1 [Pungitius sinensis]
MSHRYQGEPCREGGEEHKGPPRSGQTNGTSPGEPPVRRSWRPCQMANQDGELDPHHHHQHHPQPSHRHHPPPSHGPPRHRRRSSSGQSPGLVPSVAASSPDGRDSRDAESHPVPQPRTAVTRYRRHGDPNPRLRGHRQRQPVRAMQDSSPGVDEQAATQRTPDNSVTDQLQDRGSPRQSPAAVVTPTQLSPGPATNKMPHHPQHAPAALAEEDLQELKVECEVELEAVEERHEDREQTEEDGDHCSTAGHSSCSHNDLQAGDDKAEEHAEKDEEVPEEVLDDVAEDVAAQGSELTDLCSDTESAASLSLDGPLHSPPPLHSPTPPSSPDVPPFPQLDHLSEDTSLSPLPDNDLLPEDEDEDCSDSCSHFTSCADSYPKTYADFYTESHQKSYPEPIYESYSEPKCHPNSFPEPLKTSYPELHREPRRPAGWRMEPNDVQQEPFTSRGQEDVQQGAPSTKGPYCAPRQGRGRGPHHSPLNRSVGCRLHHYDGQSDGEGESPAPRSRGQLPRRAEALAKSPSSGQTEAPEGRNVEGLQGEKGTRGSGDAIVLAIKDIKEAIEEVKIKAVRSPYTPDKPAEPIWVMRQEASPVEEVCPLQPTAAHSSPHSPAQSVSESPSRYASLPVRGPVSPPRTESLGAHHPQHFHQPQPQLNHHHHHHQGHHSQQRDPARPPHTYAPPQPLPPNQHQQRQQQNQHQQQQQRPQVQPQSPLQQPTLQELRRSLPPFPTFVDVPGPCDPEDLIDGIIFAATYLGCTHLLSERTPTKSARMQQAQEAMSRVRAAQKQAKNRKRSPDSEAPATAEVDLFMSTQRIKVLNADTQESLMDLPLRTISYIADIGNMVVLMARGKMVRSRSAQDNLDHAAEQTTMTHDDRRLYRMICHVFESEDAQLIAQSIGQSFSVAYQEFLRANGIDPEDLSQREYSDLLNTQDMYNDDLIHFSKSENCKDVYIEKQKGEILGVVIVESGWGSILPTVIIASMMHAGPAEKSSRLNIGDQIMTINGTSLVGLPLSTCQSIIKGLKSQSRIKMNIVRCPPVTMVLIRRPDLRYQLGFSVQNGIICSLMRGGIAERGGVRVGHRIIEINSQSVVATPHEKIVQILSNAMGEIHMKTMPAAMYRLLTAQEQPVYI